LLAIDARSDWWIQFGTAIILTAGQPLFEILKQLRGAVECSVVDAKVEDRRLEPSVSMQYRADCGHFRRKAITCAAYACYAVENASSGQSCMT
jgi:hypothetical protein